MVLLTLYAVSDIIKNVNASVLSIFLTGTARPGCVQFRGDVSSKTA